MDLVEQLAAAIARVEGGGRADSLAARNNNPGNLRSWGSYPVVSGYVKFPDYATGYAALKEQVRKNIARGLTLDEFFAGKPGVYAGYAPAADSNQPHSYARTVAGWIGIATDTPLNASGPAGGSAPPVVAESVGFDLPAFGGAAVDLETAAAGIGTREGLVWGAVALGAVLVLLWVTD